MSAAKTTIAEKLQIEPDAEACTSLSELEPGRSGSLCDHPGAAPLSERLSDLGFVAGTQLSVRRAAPLGDPLEIELRGYRVCLRKADLANVCVIPDAPRP